MIFVGHGTLFFSDSEAEGLSSTLGLVHWPGPRALAWPGPVNSNSSQFEPPVKLNVSLSPPKKCETHIPRSRGKPFLIFEFLNQIE